MFGDSISGLATESHELHRIRRGALSNFFSKGSVQRLEPVVQSVVEKLVTRLENIKESSTIVNVIDMYSSFTADIIGQYAFAEPYGFMDDPDFAPSWHKLMMDVSENSHLKKQYGWLEPLMRSMPVALVKIVAPKMIALIDMKNVLKPCTIRFLR